MISMNPGRAAGFAAGVTLLFALGACSDAPSAPARAPHPAVLDAPRLGATSAEGAAMSRAITRAARRYVRQADGSIMKIESLTAADHRAYVVQSSLDANGLARTVEVSRDGQVIARVVNDWRETAAGFTLARQRLVRLGGDGTSQEFDSERHGGIAQMAGAPVLVSTRTAAAAMHAASVSLRPGFRSAYGSDDSSGDQWPVTGPCDDKARAADSALDNWIGSMLLLGSAMATGNPVLTFSAGVYEVKAWRDFTRAEDALDQCVADAGKKKEDDF